MSPCEMRFIGKSKSIDKFWFDVDSFEDAVRHCRICCEAKGFEFHNRITGITLEYALFDGKYRQVVTNG